MNKQIIDHVQVARYNRYDYSEAAALQVLLEQLDIQMKESTEAINEALNVNTDAARSAQCMSIDDSSTFSIIINGRSIEFGLGGPQCEALYAFVNHIAAENAYGVDLATNTVTGW